MPQLRIAWLWLIFLHLTPWIRLYKQVFIGLWLQPSKSAGSGSFSKPFLNLLLISLLEMTPLSSLLPCSPVSIIAMQYFASQTARRMTLKILLQLWHCVPQLTGDLVRMCFPSIAPVTCGRFHWLSNCCEIFSQSFGEFGGLRYARARAS